MVHLMALLLLDIQTFLSHLRPACHFPPISRSIRGLNRQHLLCLIILVRQHHMAHFLNTPTMDHTLPPSSILAILPMHILQCINLHTSLLRSMVHLDPHQRALALISLHLAQRPRVVRRNQCKRL